jgi:hypothetical protein
VAVVTPAGPEVPVALDGRDEVVVPGDRLVEVVGRAGAAPAGVAFPGRRPVVVVLGGAAVVSVVISGGRLVVVACCAVVGVAVPGELVTGDRIAVVVDAPFVPRRFVNAPAARMPLLLAPLLLVPRRFVNAPPARMPLLSSPLRGMTTEPAESRLEAASSWRAPIMTVRATSPPTMFRATRSDSSRVS